MTENSFRFKLKSNEMPKHNRKSKSENLIQKGTLNERPQVVLDELFGGGSFFDPCDMVQVKYEMLRRVANGQSVAEAIRATAKPQYILTEPWVGYRFTASGE
jgi:hypothetical protein